MDIPDRFNEALDYILNKVAIPSGEWDEAMWNEDRESINTRAFWSANVENVRFLSRAKESINDALSNNVETIIDDAGNEKVVLKSGGRAEFVKSMRRIMIKEGMINENDSFYYLDNNDVKDIRSETRLELIYDTNMRLSYGYGQWKQGMSPNVINVFPAWKFVRLRRVREERARHLASEGEVRLKTDAEYWANYQNDPLIGGFGVPWAPFGYNSGMNITDVSRSEAKALGLIKDKEKIKKEDIPEKQLNEGLKSHIGNIDSDMKKKLIEELTKKRERMSSSEAGLQAALKVREANGFIELAK